MTKAPLSRAEQSELNTQLILAVRDANTEEVIRLLAAGANPNSKQTKLETALIRAVMADHLEIATLLLQSGAVMNEVSSHRESALFFAIRTGSIEMVKLFIQFKANINHDPYLGDPLIHATESKRNDMVKLLLSAGANSNFINDNHQSAMSIAAENGDEITFNLLFKHNQFKSTVSSNAPSRKTMGMFASMTMLMYASTGGNTNILRSLLEHDASPDINAVNLDKRTALMLAVERGLNNVISILLKAGADRTLLDKYGDSVLSMAAMHSSLETFMSLVDNSTPLNTINAAGETLFIKASQHANKAICQFLMDANLDVHADRGKTAVECAGSYLLDIRQRYEFKAWLERAMLLKANITVPRGEDGQPTKKVSRRRL